jgi:PAS domain S-box-containing protein
MSAWTTAIALLEGLADGVALCSADGRLRFVNRAMPPVAIGGDAIDAIQGGLQLTAASTIALSTAFEALRVAITGAFDVELETDGERRRFHVHGALARVDESDMVLLQFRDVTAHEEAKRAFESRFQLLQTIIDAIPSPIFYKDRAGVYRGCNKAFERYIGHPAERVVGSTVYDVAPRDLADKYRAMDDELMRQRGVQVYEHGVRYADGTIHEVVFHKATFEGEAAGEAAGEVAGLVGVMLDITERKHAEEEVRRAAEATNAAMKLKSRFLAIMSHEIRTPLNGVLGMIELLSTTPLAEDQERMMVVARESAEHLLHLVTSVLDLSKLDAGRIELEAIDFLVPDLMDGVLAAMAPQASIKRVALEHAIADDVPLAVRGDAARFRQILFNLISNAVKFSDDGRVTVSVTLAEPAGEHVALRVAVRDSGIGIAKDAQGRLCGEFMQADESIARRYGGTGLGLAITKRLVERMGGAIGVDSEPGQGATFWFTVRFAPAERDPGAIPSSRRTAPPPSSARPLRVLVVEDNAVNQLVAAGLLRSLGHAVTVVNGGAEAVDAVRCEAFDIVLMDVEMPGMDGFEATRRIRALPGACAEIPILAVTAHALVGISERCERAGMNGSTTKPLQLARLADAIAFCLDRRGRASHASLPAEAAAARGVEPILDEECLDALERAVGRDALCEALEQFLTLLPQRIAVLADRGGDRDVAFREAHSLRGMAAQVGAARLASVAGQCEAALRSEPAAPLALTDLREAAEAARAAATAVIARCGAKRSP